MPARFLLHALFLSVAALTTYLWTIHPIYSTYTLQLVAVLILLYFAAHFRGKRKGGRNILTLDLVILTIIILLLVAETGGLASPLIFTLYFLLFAVALLFEIQATLLLTGVLIIFLTLLPTTNLNNLGELTELIALVMITPLAIFTGHQYENLLKEKELRRLGETHLEEEETDTLLFLSLNLKRTLTSALDNLSRIIPQVHLTRLRNDLTRLHSDLRELYRAAGELQETIDQTTD